MSDVRPAATVLVLRDSPQGVEVLMLRRHARSGFAADAWVFPGGTVDDADRTLDPACWRGIEPETLAQRFDATADEVLGFHVAAVRETFEEAGLLLAAHVDGTPVDLDDPDVQAQRALLNDRGRAGAGEFSGWLVDKGLVAHLDTLTYLSRWVTPTFEKRRYDTCFFVANAPAEQVADHDRIETTGQRWITPADALAAYRRHEMLLIYPTILTLHRLEGASDVAEVIAGAAAQPEVRSVQPHVVVDDDGNPARILHPDEPDYPHQLYP